MPGKNTHTHTRTQVNTMDDSEFDDMPSLTTSTVPFFVFKDPLVLAFVESMRKSDRVRMQLRAYYLAQIEHYIEHYKVYNNKVQNVSKL